MRTIDEIKKQSYRMEVVEDYDDGGFVVSFPDLPGCISCGGTIENAIKNAIDAKNAWIEAVIADGRDVPDAIDSYSGQFKLRLPKSLHRSLSIHSKEEGVSMNQYCVYLLSMNDAKNKS